ncbi:MAG: transketolase [Clostridiales bacterium]|jgi:transketolase|nr:transketolase [Clostridiales bacterium]
MNAEKKQYLEEMARDIRAQVITMIGEAGKGHVGGSLSIADVIAVLYFHQMRIDPNNPKMEGRDRLILSKGHAGPAVYAALAVKGYFPMEWLKTLNKPGTNLPSHCDMTKTPGIDMTAGSLGQGISCAVGVAKAAAIARGDEYIYAIVGDGESQEGSVWEASMSAAQFKLDNLIAFLDNNGMQIDGTVDEVVSLRSPAAKWEAFGFKVFRVDGHDVEAISDAIDMAKAQKDGRPAMIVLDTIKGKGVKFIEEEGTANHSMSLNDEQISRALDELYGRAK